jgi:hypothetical protein
VSLDVKPLPCSFCAGVMTDMRCRKGLFWVECRVRICEARGPAKAGVDDAVSAWNRVAEMRAVLEELVQWSDDEAAGHKVKFAHAIAQRAQAALGKRDS